jgi:hypothetical protein
MDAGWEGEETVILGWALEELFQPMRICQVILRGVSDMEDGSTAQSLLQNFGFYKLILATTLGAFVLYILNRLQNRQPFSFFRALNIEVGNSAGAPTIFFDMLISSLIGAIVVYLLTEPATVPQAVIAGLGMTGVLSAHAKETGG